MTPQEVIAFAKENDLKISRLIKTTGEVCTFSVWYRSGAEKILSFSNMEEFRDWYDKNKYDLEYATKLTVATLSEFCKTTGLWCSRPETHPNGSLQFCVKELSGGVVNCVFSYLKVFSDYYTEDKEKLLHAAPVGVADGFKQVAENCDKIRKQLITDLQPSQTIQEEIRRTCDKVRDLLVRKNNDYGNSALESPVLLPDMPADAALWVRLGDKFKRLQSLNAKAGKSEVDESIDDTLEDAIGYCVLLLISRKSGK